MNTTHKCRFCQSTVGAINHKKVMTNDNFMIIDKANLHVVVDKVRESLQSDNRMYVSHDRMNNDSSTFLIARQLAIPLDTFINKKVTASQDHSSGVRRIRK